MVKEYKMLKEKGVFELTSQPPERNIVSSKWVYAIKWKDDSTVDKQKARIVAKGFTQVLGEDYNTTYASVAQLESVQLVCAIATSRRLRLWQINFTSAFFSSKSSFDIYMEQPKGFEKRGDDLVWRLHKTLYGTMQSTHN